MKNTITEAAIFRAHHLLKHFYQWNHNCKNGLGPIAVASFEAGAHVRKTIEALITSGADDSHLDFYYQMHARLVSFDNENYTKGQLGVVFCQSMHGIA